MSMLCHFHFKIVQFSSPKYRIVLSALMISLLCSSTLAYSNEDVDLWDLSLEELMDIKVFTPSRYSQDADQSAGIISIITKQEIQTYGARNLTDVLNRLPGAMVQFDNIYQHSSVLLRGDKRQENHVLMLVDGKPYRSPTDGNLISLALVNFFPIETIERIEVIRGPGSVIYGSNAFTGVINIITKPVTHENKTNGQLAIYAGSNSSKRANLTQRYNSQKNVSGDKNNNSGLISLSQQETDGWDASFIAAGVGMPLEADYQASQKSQSVFGNWQQPWLDVSFFHHDSELGGYRFKNTNNAFRASQIDLSHISELGNTDIELQVSWYDEKSTIDTSTISGNNFRLGSYLISEISPFHILSAGFNLEFLDFSIIDNFGKIPELGLDFPTKEYDGDVKKSNLYLQWEGTTVSKVFSWVIGGQVNQAGGETSRFLPRLSLVSRLSDQYSLKAMYSEAYRSPTLLETDLDAIFLAGQADNEPEEVQTIDLQLLFHTNSTYATLTGYVSQTDKILNNTNFQLTNMGIEPGVFENQGGERFYGIELEWKYQFNSQLGLDSSATWQSNEDEDGNKNQSGAPNGMFKFGLRYIPMPELSIGAFYSHIGAYQDVVKLYPDKIALNPIPTATDFLSVHIKNDLHQWVSGIPANRLVLGIYLDNFLDEKQYIAQTGLGANNSFRNAPERTWTFNLSYRY